MAKSAKENPGGSPRLVPRKAPARSRISNGGDILPDPAHAYGPPGERAVMPGGKGMRQSGLPHRSISLLQEFYSRPLPLA